MTRYKNEMLTLFGATALASATPALAETVRYENGQWFDGKAFVAGERTVSNGRFVGSGVKPDRTVDLEGAFVISPMGDAHTHQFDGPWTFDPQNDAQLRSGTFYIMTMTAPVSGVSQVRYRFDDWDTVDVATSLGGVTGPSSHPAEVYEAVALRIFSFEEQVARQDEIRASTRAKNDAYWVVEDEASLTKVWRELMHQHPDVVKVFLRHSAQYGPQQPDNWAIGGVDPALLPSIAERAKRAGVRLAVAASDISDVRAAINAGADILTHLPCYQDTSEPGLYFYEATDENCLLTDADAQAIAEQGMAVTIIASELAKEQALHVRARLEANVTKLREAGAKMIIGSNSYSETARAGLIREANRDLFSSAELLRLATIYTPQTIFPDRAIGCLDAGCEASFITLGDNPLEDMSALERIGMRIKRGKTLELARQD